VVEFPLASQFRSIPSEYRTHLSKLDERMLARVAVESGGLYVRSKATLEDTERIHQEIEALATRAVSGDVRYTRVNRYRWPLAGALACFAAEGLWVVLMPWIRKRRMARARHTMEGAAHA
jgi:hypothetical protein